MSVTQVIKWRCLDGKEFEREEDAITHAAYLLRYEELDQVLDQIWCRDMAKDEVIEALLDNFIFTPKV